MVFSIPTAQADPPITAVYKAEETSILPHSFLTPLEQCHRQHSLGTWELEAQAEDQLEEDLHRDVKARPPETRPFLPSCSTRITSLPRHLYCADHRAQHRRAGSKRRCNLLQIHQAQGSKRKAPSVTRGGQADLHKTTMKRKHLVRIGVVYCSCCSSSLGHKLRDGVVVLAFELE